MKLYPLIFRWEWWLAVAAFVVVAGIVKGCT